MKYNTSVLLANNNLAAGQNILVVACLVNMGRMHKPPQPRAYS
jgi:hypothetical protein